MLSRAPSWKSPLVWKCDIRWVWINMRRPFLSCLHRVASEFYPPRVVFLPSCVSFVLPSSTSSSSSITTLLSERAHRSVILKLFYLKFYNSRRKDRTCRSFLPTRRTSLMMFSVCTTVHRTRCARKFDRVVDHRWSPVIWHWRVPLIYLNEHLTIKIRGSNFILAILSSIFVIIRSYLFNRRDETIFCARSKMFRDMQNL